MTKTNKQTPRPVRAFEENQRKEDKKTSSVDYETTKPSDPKSSNKNIRIETRQTKSEVNISRLVAVIPKGRKIKIIFAFRENLEEEEEEEEESTMTRLQSNGADWNSRSVIRVYEEDNKTCRSLTGEEKISHRDRSDNLDKLAGKNREYAEGYKDLLVHATDIGL